jgi:hypothetical protein
LSSRPGGRSSWRHEGGFWSRTGLARVDLR